MEVLWVRGKNMKKLLWVDLEMTGLDHLKERILECAIVVTDWDFHVLEKYEAVLHQPKEILDQMDEFS